MCQQRLLHGDDLSATRSGIDTSRYVLVLTSASRPETFRTITDGTEQNYCGLDSQVVLSITGIPQAAASCKVACGGVSLEQFENQNRA